MGLEAEIMTVKDAALQWGITPRRVQVLCDNGRVQGAIRLGGTWIIPKTTAFGAFAVRTDNGMTILFWEPDIPYVPPVWPEETGKQQKQMHLDFTVNDVPSHPSYGSSYGASIGSG